VNFLRHPRPQIADVQCTRLKFAPGDRILVRVHTKLDKHQIKSLRKSITKWAGCEVEVLIYNGLEMDIVPEQVSGAIKGR
jgi:hypothetical protein